MTPAMCTPLAVDAKGGLMGKLDSTSRFLSAVVKRAASGARAEEEATVARRLADLKSKAVGSGDEDAAKEVWCYEQVLAIQSRYLDAFQAIKEAHYFGAWCLLDDVEIRISWLYRHFWPPKDKYKLRSIQRFTSQYQSIFPYKHFMSPALLCTEKRCSICGKKISFRTPCGHRVGEIYHGEMCVREIKECEVLEISLVETPAWKKNVVFPRSGTGVPEKPFYESDFYDYSAVRFVVNRLHSPFDGWDLQWTQTRHPHSFFQHLGPDDECPCGSGKAYGDC
ncbi:MAG: hypothetical protein M1305_02785, partial [Candidatus Marsarchaeota archaeon]|nr:hypothetical protein [Candidatus Marsarchaeota archaeon]